VKVLIGQRRTGKVRKVVALVCGRRAFAHCFSCFCVPPKTKMLNFISDNLSNDYLKDSQQFFLTAIKFQRD